MPLKLTIHIEGEDLTDLQKALNGLQIKGCVGMANSGSKQKEEGIACRAAINSGRRCRKGAIESTGLCGLHQNRIKRYGVSTTRIVEGHPDF